MTSLSRIRRKLERKFNKDKSPKGLTGIYVKLSSKRGIKVYRNTKSSIEWLEKDLAQSEVRNIKMARRLFPYIPKCHGLRVIKLNGGYIVGVILQHLGNKTVRKIYGKSCYVENIVPKLTEKLFHLGIHHDDIHNENVMYFRGKYWVIDFTRVWVKQKII